jgi:hypothetical protein
MYRDDEQAAPGVVNQRLGNFIASRRTASLNDKMINDSMIWTWWDESPCQQSSELIDLNSTSCIM